MGLNLWLDDYRNIEKYYSRRFDARGVSGQMMIGDSVDIEPLCLNIDGVSKYDFTLDEIDSFTCGFKNFEEVKEYLTNSGYGNPNCEASDLYIAKSSDTIGKYQVIYDNPLLKKCALVIQDKRKRHLPEFLDKTPEMKEYVQKIARYATAKGTSQSIRCFSLLPPHVRATLQYYSESINEKQTARASKCFDNLFKYCMNYKTLRAFIIWEEQYLRLKGEQNKKRALERKDLQEEKKQVQRSMQYEEKLRRMPLDRPVLSAIDEMRDEDGNIDFDRVYGQFDLDDIYSNPDMLLQAVGILPPEVPDTKDEKRNLRK